MTTEKLIAQTTGLAGHLARELVAMRGAGLPELTQQRARLALLDTVGAMVVGAAYSGSAAAVRATVLGLGHSGTARILGSGTTSSSVLAALANGVASHSLDVDDAHRHVTGYHPGATVLPAVLSLASERNASVDRVVEALVVGYEAGGRIGRAINPSHRYRGFHSTGTVGVFGAAAAAGTVLDLDADQMASALGIAGSMAGGVFAFLDGMHPTKHLHAGHAAMSGVLSALLAQEGLSGPSSILDGPEGFFAAYADEAFPERVLARLGEHDEVHATYFKPYATCGHAFSAIEAAMELRSQGLNIDEVSSVEIESYRAAAVLDGVAPATVQQGQFSLPFLTALGLASGRFGIRDVQGGLADSRLLELASATTVREDREMTEAYPRVRAARVSVVLKDGTERSAYVDTPRGMPERPLERSDVIDKYRQLAEPVLDTAQCDWLQAAVLRGSGPADELLSVELIHRGVIA